jgi:hypothetical protein
MKLSNRTLRPALDERATTFPVGQGFAYRADKVAATAVFPKARLPFNVPRASRSLVGRRADGRPCSCRPCPVT